MAEKDMQTANVLMAERQRTALAFSTYNVSTPLTYSAPLNLAPLNVGLLPYTSHLGLHPLITSGTLPVKKVD
jgi:hypothetical protein